MSRYDAIKLDMEIKEGLRTIETRLKKAMAEEFNHRIQSNMTRIENSIKDLVKELIYNSPEIKSIKRGQLRGAFGIPASEDPTSQIVNAIAESVEVIHTIIVPKSGKRFSGGLTINIQPKHVANLLGLSGGKVKTKKDTTLPWLEWLLTFGDKIIVTDYHVEYKSGTGRSGRATMADGDTFRVDPSFSGTKDNNFISRALSGSEDKMKQIIRRHIG